MFATILFAQDEKLVLCIYAVVASNATHLLYTLGVVTNSGTNLLGVELGNTRYTYKREASLCR